MLLVLCQVSLFALFTLNAQKRTWSTLMRTADSPDNGSGLLGTDSLSSCLIRLSTTSRLPSHYTPFGYQGMPVLRRLGFTGNLREVVNQGYLLGQGYRLFLPAIMRFTSPDEVSPFEAGGFNAYAYCAAEPVNRIDPDGRSFITSSVKGVGNLLGRKTSASLARKYSRAVSNAQLIDRELILRKIPVKRQQILDAVHRFGKELKSSTINQPRMHREIIYDDSFSRYWNLDAALYRREVYKRQARDAYTILSARGKADLVEYLPTYRDIAPPGSRFNLSALPPSYGSLFPGRV